MMPPSRKKVVQSAGDYKIAGRILMAQGFKRRVKTDTQHSFHLKGKFPAFPVSSLGGYPQPLGSVNTSQIQDHAAVVKIPDDAVFAS